MPIQRVVTLQEQVSVQVIGQSARDIVSEHPILLDKGYRALSVLDDFGCHMFFTLAATQNGRLYLRVGHVMLNVSWWDVLMPTNTVHHFLQDSKYKLFNRYFSHLRAS